MIDIDGVSRRYDGRRVLDRVSLQVPPESTVALIGPSGCGKSTLIRIMIGLIAPEEGIVQVNGTPVNPDTVTELRLRTGYVIQDGGLFPHLTARENVQLMARHLRWDSARQRRRLEELAGLVQLPLHALDRYPLQLSGGQRQRVSLMRALFLEPRVLLMDEPLGALDPMIRAQLQSDLKAIFGQLKTTTVIVTHDMAEAAYLGDEIVLMRDGGIVQRGPLSDLVERPAEPFVTEFLAAQNVRVSP